MRAALRDWFRCGREADLVALADCAIELIAVMGVLESLGFEIDVPVAVSTENKGASDLCHRYTLSHKCHVR